MNQFLLNISSSYLKIASRLLFLAFLASMPFSVGINNIFLIPLVIILFIRIGTEKIYRQWKVPYWVFIPALLPVIWFFLSGNHSYTGKIVLNHILISGSPFLLFPVLKEVPLLETLKYLIIGTLSITIVSLSGALLKVAENDSWFFIETSTGWKYYYLQYTRLSPLLHPTYLSMFINVSLISILYIKLNWIIKAILFVYLSIFLFLLSAKAGILGFIVLFIFFIFSKMKNAYYIVVIFTLLALVIGYISSSNLFKRVNKSIYEVERFRKDPDNYSFNNSSTSLRIQRYTIAYKLFQEKPFFGYGTNDAMKIVSNNASPEDYAKLQQKDVGMDGQYIDYLLMWGVVGFIIIMFYFTLLVKVSFKIPDYLGLMILLPILTTMLFESVFDRQKGVLISILLISIILNSTLNKSKLE